MKNKHIVNNDFLRLYLFNNSVIKLTMVEDKFEGSSIEKSVNKMERVISKFEGIYPCQKISKPVIFSQGVRMFEKEFNYNRFKEILDL